jgi:protein-S-isoprenylcysteine O-methyltransferase Ste14
MPTTVAAQTQDSLSSSLLVRYGNFLFRYRNVVFPLTWFTVFAVFRPVYAGGTQQRDLIVDIIGLAVGLSGQTLRALVIGYKYVKRGGKDKQVYADTLVTEGFFNHSRNPLYLGNLLVLFGLIIIHNHPLVYAILVPFFLISYIAIVAAEEHYLRSKFGEEYEAYRRRVNRWLPNFHGLGNSLRGMRFAWQRVVVKEYGTIYVFLSGAVALVMDETLVHYTYAQQRTYINVLAGLLVVFAIGYGLARYLKKSETLTSA